MDDCQKKWKQLRDAYTRHLRKKQTKSGQAAKNWKPWKYEMEISFIDKYIKANDATSSNLTKSSLDERQEGSITDTDDSSSFVSRESAPVSVSRENLPRPSTSNENNREVSGGPAKRKKNVDTPSSSTSAVIEYLKSRDTQDKDDDEIGSFFHSMATITRRLPLSAQIRIRQKLCELVTNEEINYIAQAENSSFEPPRQMTWRSPPMNISPQQPISCGPPQQPRMQRLQSTTDPNEQQMSSFPISYLTELNEPY